MNAQTNTFTRRTMVVTLFLDKQPDKEASLLCVCKRADRSHDPCAGYVLAGPGGKMTSEDLGPISAADRESSAETGLHMLGGRIVARLNVRFRKKKRWNTVHIILCRRWEGRLRWCRREFKWVKFIPLSRLPWNDMPPGDVGWLRAVLFEGKKVVVSIAVNEHIGDLVRQPRMRRMGT
jgi:ADP-ribose pyrophosphatase YjhB (NUDIX family)